MEIQHDFDGKRGSFFIEEGARRFAEIVYGMAGPKRMIIEHTEVGDIFKGQGVGAKLLETLVEYVRKEQIKVIPLCPFAKATFKKRPDLQDVLDSKAV